MIRLNVDSYLEQESSKFKKHLDPCEPRSQGQRNHTDIHYADLRNLLKMQQ